MNMIPALSVMADVLEMTTENVAAVVITGMVVVFIGLILLIWFVQILGFLFTKFAKSKDNNDSDVVSDKRKTVSSAPAPVVEDGISDEVVAVIAATIAAMGAKSGKKLVLKSVRTAKPQRNEWAFAGLLDNTRPFF